MTKMDNSHCVVGIVEDDRAVRDALCNLLSSVGLHVAAFGSAEELIESTQSKQLGCLILDVCCRERVDLSYNAVWRKTGISFRSFS